MSSSPHSHCDCGAHHHAARSADQRAALWSSLPALLACAVCPACIATYAKLFSLLGLGLELTELQHSLLLGAALSISLLVSTWRSMRTRRAWPVVFALLGSSLVLLGHVAGDRHELEWTGVLVLVVSGVVEQLRLRRLALA
jgi:hypothetical protein